MNEIKYETKENPRFVFLAMKFAALVAILILIGLIYLNSNLSPQNSSRPLPIPDFSELILNLEPGSSQVETVNKDHLNALRQNSIAQDLPEGGLMLISLWAHWCWPCLTELPLLNKIHERLSTEGLIVLAINLDEDDEQQIRADSFWSQQALSMASLRMSLEEFRQVFPAPINGIPFHALIDSQGQILWAKQGAMDWSHPQALASLTKLLTKNRAFSD